MYILRFHKTWDIFSHQIGTCILYYLGIETAAEEQRSRGAGGKPLCPPAPLPPCRMSGVFVTVAEKDLDRMFRLIREYQDGLCRDRV